MNDTKIDMLMIGLHKLAAARGDGLIPELMALYAERDRRAADDFSGTLMPIGDEASTKSAGNDNVIAFRPYLVAKRRKG